MTKTQENTANAGVGAGGAARTAANGSLDPSGHTPAVGEVSHDDADFEVLRCRLDAQAAELAHRIDRLDRRRVEVFGSTELRLLGGARLHTAGDRVLRDLAWVGNTLLAGGTTASRTGELPAIEAVFSLHRPEGVEGGGFVAAPAEDAPGLLIDPALHRDMAELFRYYRDAELRQLRFVDGLLLAVFQAGPRPGDVRVLRWRLSDSGAVYLDARGERDHVFPEPYDFAWTTASRDDHRPGRNPHVSVHGEVFVSTVGGSLRIRTLDDPETTDGTIHREPVDEPLQSLADAEIGHARVGTLILLRIRPYKENAWRHFVFTTTNGTAVRLDGIGQGARRLPGDEGIVFPGGFHLGTGAYKEFDADTGGMEFERVVRSPNGEDHLYVFRHREHGRTVLLSYNAIRKDVATPLTGRAFTLLDDGTLVILRGDTEPKRAHPVQVWATPYATDAYAAAQPQPDGPLGRVGNADLVDGIADALAVVRLVRETGTTTAAFEAVLAACTRVADRHHWLTDPELGGLHEPLDGLRETAGHVLAAFTAVRELTQAAAQAVDREADRIAALIRQARTVKPRGADAWIARLAELRTAQGSLAPLRTMRHADTARIDALHRRLDDELTGAARQAAASLSEPDAFAEQRAAVAELAHEAEHMPTVADADPLNDRLDELALGLRVVTDTVGDLDITDTTARTAILAQVADVQSELARARAVLTTRRTVVAEQEGRAEAAAQFALLVQTISAALAAADTPDACDDHLGRVLLRIEDLAARFPELDGLHRDLDAKRDEVQDAFAVRRQALVDERARHTARLTESAARILDGLPRRASGRRDLGELDAYFAADPMVAKVHRAISELRELGEPVAAEELDGRLKAVRQQAARVLRDRGELADDDGTTVRLGHHRFAINTQTVNLTLVPRDGRMAFALTGTDYRRTVEDPRLNAARDLWSRTLPSESPEVYRAEFLAAKLLAEHGPSRLADLDEAELTARVRAAAQAAYDEGYERGVHDHDAAVILAALLRLHAGAGLLRYPPADRATAQLLWAHGCDDTTRREWAARARSLGRARDLFGTPSGIEALYDEIATAVTRFTTDHGGFDGSALGRHPARTAEYLVEELALGDNGFVTTDSVPALLDKFRHAVDGHAYDDVLPDLRSLSARRHLVEAWLSAYAEASGEPVAPGDLAEAVAVELCPDLPRYVHAAPTRDTVTGLLGTHPRVRDGRLPVRIDELLPRVADFRAHAAPAFRAYQNLRAELIAAERERLRVDEHRPSVVTTFVRNRLIDRVYLPLIGDNLARQLGAAGARKRTDTQGLLLLISPPGYGKTTLVEYVASRLGMLLVKVDGPALGHAVTSLDPAEAPNATARREIEKINFALEAGTNVMLYVDDIQHTSPEFLQKFIPLCDAQRRVSGVRDGRAHTYDLRGKRFAVVMAGNPFTEEGRRFRVPDMLANRADVWNLGDVLAGHRDAFTLSFVENALTANPVLAPLAEQDAHDLDLLLHWAANPDEPVRPDRLTHPRPPAELDRVLSVLRSLIAARDTVLTVNAAYMASAAQTDDTRTEPPFRLQGSYRTMNRIAERITPAMNRAELDAVITDHYEAQAMTLAADAEANLLKLADLRGTLTTTQAARWTALKAAYA